MYSPCDSGGHLIEGFVQSTGERDGVPIGERTSLPTFFIVPNGMEKMIKYLVTRYNNTTMFVTENGFAQLDQPGDSGSELLNDFKRVEYHKSYLASLLRAIREGADVRGYFVWSLLDNFEWRYGFTRRFGLYYVDYRTLMRTPKFSAKWYEEFLANYSNSNEEAIKWNSSK
ncbi:hypothetical protein MRB53_022472 [Persea americana]|uniref:Uncharacterized protein n=1 Tax=Persea americana TaxID=3435 RepID=A0ACC2L6U0_PERAE|nr:hypothetical protein MRB53_022472 [Persea americana]